MRMRKMTPVILASCFDIHMGTWYKYILLFINLSFSVPLPLLYPSELDNDDRYTLSGLEWLTMDQCCLHIISDQNDDWFPNTFLKLQHCTPWLAILDPVLQWSACVALYLVLCLEFCEALFIFLISSSGVERPSWPWWFGSWIYNYLYNQCLSPLKLWVRTPVHGEVYSIQHYVIQFFSYLRKVVGFLRVLRFPPAINWPPRYNWNIVESGVKLHKSLVLLFLFCFVDCGDIYELNDANPSVTITSPNYPLTYPPRKKCNYIFKVNCFWLRWWVGWLVYGV